MSYNPLTDFIGLLRQVGSGEQRFERMPGLDFVVAAMARAGMFTVSVSAAAPTVDVETTVWVKPASPSWSAEASVFIFNQGSGQYEPATPLLWASIFSGGSLEVTQDVISAGPVNILPNAKTVRVFAAAGGPVTLILPPSSIKTGTGVLVSDWTLGAGTKNITVQRFGTDVLPGGNISWTIAADFASLFFRTVPGGYTI